MIGQVGVALFMLISAYFLAFSTSNPCTRLVKPWTQVFIYSFGLLVLFFAYTGHVDSTETVSNSDSRWRFHLSRFTHHIQRILVRQRILRGGASSTLHQ